MPTIPPGGAPVTGPTSRRVAITGVGLLTPLGSDVGSTWARVLAGVSAVRRVTRFDASPFRSQVAAEIACLPQETLRQPKLARRLDRFSLLGVLTGEQALRDARLEDLDQVDRDRIGIYVGSALGGVAHGEEQHARFLAGERAVDPYLALTVFGGAAAANLAIDLEVHGPVVSNANSCASGLVALGDAYRSIARGEIDLALAGGVEAPLAPLTFGSFDAIRALSQRNDAPEKASRPFDCDRDGFVMAEGAAMLVLEEWEQARTRCAPVYAEVLGYGTANDGYHMTAPRPDGSQAERCIRLALENAGIQPEDVAVVSAHASATPLGDRAEALALGRVFGASEPLIFATKGAHGHALGATPAIETALLALTLRDGCAPPSVNLDQPEEGMRLRFTSPRQGQSVQGQYGLKTAFGFGGMNACLVLRSA